MLNWKLRIRNKTTLTAITGTIIALIYQVFGIIGVTPPISENVVVEWVGIVITLLMGVGVVVDPTTRGIGDSPRAMDYVVPSCDDGNIADYDDEDEITLDELLAVLQEDDEDPDDDEEVEVQEEEE